MTVAAEELPAPPEPATTPTTSVVPDDVGRSVTVAVSVTVPQAAVFEMYWS